jgi:integrase
MLLKDTKSHQMRRLSIDPSTVELLRRHREDCAARLALFGLTVTDQTWVFSAKPDLSEARDPASIWTSGGEARDRHRAEGAAALLGDRAANR